MGKQIYKITLLVAVSLIMSSTIALAHKVIVFAWVEQGRIHIEGSFGSDRPAKKCVITVTNPEGILIHQGITDGQGLYSFSLPDKMDSDLIVGLSAGTGHTGSWTISENELVAKPSPENLEKKMAEKQLIEKDPSLVRIAGGIAVIFGLAFVAARIKKRKNKIKSDVL